MLKRDLGLHCARVFAFSIALHRLIRFVMLSRSTGFSAHRHFASAIAAAAAPAAPPATPPATPPFAAGGRDGGTGDGRFPVCNKGVDPELNFTSMVGNAFGQAFLWSSLPLTLAVRGQHVQHVHRSESVLPTVCSRIMRNRCGFDRLSLWDDRCSVGWGSGL